MDILQIHRQRMRCALECHGARLWTLWPAHSDCAGDDHDGLVWRAGGIGFIARGQGFNMAKFLNFFMLITFAYCFREVL